MQVGFYAGTLTAKSKTSPFTITSRICKLSQRYDKNTDSCKACPRGLHSFGLQA